MEQADRAARFLSFTSYLALESTMPISDKTRKILWGRSGSRCAICKHELVIDATARDDESVVGDECHIRSARENGPRHDSAYPRDSLDSYENLVLLCRTHHKMVDDQEDTYTAQILRQMKASHEVWVSARLTDQTKPKPLRMRRVKQNIPPYLPRLTTGQQVLDVLIGSYGYLTQNDDPQSEEEVDLIGNFLQAATDWAEMGDDLEPHGRVSAAFSLTQLIQDLDEAGFWVFGGRETRILEGGLEPEPSPWPVGIIAVLRKDNRGITEANLGNLTQ